jgi:hypothetical protein
MMNKLQQEMKEMEIAESKNDKNTSINDNKSIDNVKNNAFYDINNNNNNKIKATRNINLDAKLLQPPQKFNSINSNNINKSGNNTNDNRKVIQKPHISSYRTSSSGRPGIYLSIYLSINIINNILIMY